MTPAELTEIDADRARARWVFVCWLVLATALTLAGNAAAAVLPSLPPTGVRLAVHLLPPLIALVGLHALTALARAGAIHRARKGVTAALRDAGPVYGGAVGGVLGILTIAAVMSYAGLIEVARAGGLKPGLAAVWPLHIDLGIAVCSAALLVLRPISAADQRTAKRAASATAACAVSAPALSEPADAPLQFSATARTEAARAEPAEPRAEAADPAPKITVEIAELATRITKARVVRKPAEAIAAVLAAHAAGWSITRIEREVGVHRDVAKKVVAAAEAEARSMPRLAAIR